MSLDNLGIKYGTDKASVYNNRRGHDYLRHYEGYLEKFRSEEFLLIEIGVYKGSSLRMWKEYFPNAQIVGIDVNPEAAQYEEERISIIIGDAYSEAMRDNIVDKYGNPRILVEDGSHLPYDQINSLEIYFPVLEKGGYYILEDMTSELCNATKNYLQERLNRYLWSPAIITSTLKERWRLFPPAACYLEFHMDAVVFIPSNYPRAYACALIRKNFLDEGPLSKKYPISEVQEFVYHVNDSAERALEVFKNNRFSMIAVVDDKSKLVGILTAYDFKRLNPSKLCEPLDVTCNKNPLTLKGFDDPEIASKGKSRLCFPVVDENNVFIGFQKCLPFDVRR